MRGRPAVTCSRHARATPWLSRRYPGIMERAITGYHLDQEGDWVARLSCGHSQHIRHRPPFQPREWVLHPHSRDARLGTPLECALCDRAELPNDLRLVRTSPEWNEQTVPAGLKRTHQIAAGTWGRIVVHNGQLGFAAGTSPELNVVVERGSSQAIPPEVDHHVLVLGPVSFSVDFLSISPEAEPDGNREDVDRGANESEREQNISEQGGEGACFAHLLCPDCGVVLDGSAHTTDCPTRASP
jgi:tellurite methyltransferase